MATLKNSTISKLLKEGSNVAYTAEAVEKTQELTEDLVKNIARTATELAHNAGKKRITEDEIKLAFKFLIK